jgi:hypothetical protein
MILLTNISLVEYYGLVSFYCGIGIQRFNAIQTNSIFNCQILSKIEGLIEVDLYAKHSISNEELKVSVNSARIHIYSKFNSNLKLELVNLQKMFPFANNQSVINQNVTITTTSSTSFDFSNIYCKQISNSGVFLYRAFQISSLTLGCLINIPSIRKLNMDESVIGLWVNSSTSLGGESGFYLSTNNVSHVVIREPLTSTLPSVIFKHLFPIVFSLNLSQITGNLTYRVNTPVECNNYLNCSFTDFNPITIPISRSLQLEIRDGYSAISFYALNSYYVENVTMKSNSPFPFILDPFKNKTLILFEGTKNFNPEFSYFCLDQRNFKKINATVLNGNILCDIESRFKDERFFVEIYLNSTISGLNTLISETNLEFIVNELKLTPNYIENSEIKEFTILLNDSSKFILPTKYNKLKFKFSTRNTPKQDFLCVISDADIKCGSGLSFGDFGALNIYFVYLNFLEELNPIMNLTKPILVYKSNMIDSNIHAILFGQSKNVVLQFFGETFNVDDGVQKVEYYCKVQESNANYLASRLSSNQLNCTIPSLSLDKITLSAFIRVPSISNDSLSISKNSSVIYYVKQKLITFKDSVKPLFYTDIATEMMSFSFNTEIYSSLLKNVKCTLNTSESFTALTKFISSIGNSSHVINCSFTISTPGRYEAFLEYVEGNEKFSLTTNSLELVFTGKFIFLSFSPTVGYTNTSVSVLMSSNFPARNYGKNIKFITKYGFSSDIYHNETLETNYTVESNSFQFKSPFFVPNAASYLLSMWMESFGKQLEVLPPVSYKFIDSNFFTPNHGVFSGGDLLRVLKPKTLNKNIVIGNPFNINHLFNCSFISGELVCTTPTFNSTFAPFASYPLYFNENADTMSAPLIIYEKISMVSVSPTIFPFSSSSPKFSLNITLNKNVEMKEGSLIVQLNGPKSKNIEFGKLNGSVANVNQIDSNDLNAGVYQIQLNFKHPDSLAFNSQFTFSMESKNVTFFDIDSTISFTSCNNVAMVNETHSIGITRNSILSSLSPFVKCKLGNEIVPTQRIDDSHYICNVTSSKSGVQQLTIWYVNHDALNGEMQLSLNSLNLIFIEKILIHSIDPFTTMIGVITTSNLFTNYEIDVLNSNVTYRCKFGSEIATASFQSNGIFTCSISSSIDISRNESLVLQLKSYNCENWVDFSKNSVEYIFRKPVKLISISPFAKGFSSQSFDFDVSFVLNPGDSVVNDKELICKFNSTGNGFKRSKARLEGNLILCQISKSIFQNQVEYLHVGLALNTTLFSSDSSYFSNLMKFVFYQEPLNYQFINVIDNSLTGNFTIELTNYEADFNYQMNFTEQLTLKSGFFPCVKQALKLECKPSMGLLETLYQPSIYNLTLVISKDTFPSSNAPESNLSLSVKSIVYFNRNNLIISTAPFVASSVTHFIVPLKVSLSIAGRLNHEQFKFNCVNSSNGEIVSIATVVKSNSMNTTLTCYLKSQRKIETLPLAISFLCNSSNYELTSKSNMQFVETILIDNYLGFKTGKTRFTFNYPTTSFPTKFKSDYNITLMHKEENGFLKQIECQKNLAGYTFGSCISPSISHKIFPRNVQFYIYVDGEFSISLSPWFKYFEIPSISNVLPSSLVDIFASDKIIQLQSDAFFPNSQNKKYKIQYVELGNEIRECVQLNPTQISCPIPKNNQQTGNEITMKLSMDGENFEILDKKLYLYTNDINSDKSISMVRKSVTPSIISNSNQCNITIQLNIPISVNLPTNNIFIRFKDQFINELTTGIVQNEKIICNVPHFGLYNVDYPRLVNIDASLDGDIFFGEIQTIQLNGFERVKISPSLFTVGSDLKLIISNFPEINSKVKLISKTNSIEFNCNSNMTICETSTRANITDEYSIQFFVNDFRLFVPLSVEKVKILSKPILNLPTNKISREMKNMLYLQGDGFDLFKNSIKIRGIFDGNLVYASVNVLPDRIGFLFPLIKRSFKRIFSNILEISYNNGVNFEIISSDIQLIDSFTFDRISETGGQSSVTFSFQNTTLNLIGTNLNSSSAIVKLENELFSFKTTPKIFDSSRIQVIIPEFSYYSPKLTFTYPISASIGISLNDGIDYQMKSISISDKFSNLFLIGILPSVGDRKDRNITMKGANLKEVIFCEFRDSNQTLIEKVEKLIQGEEILCPFIYNSKYNYLNEFQISLRNSFNDTSEKLKFSLIENPFPSEILPSKGDAVGNYSVIVQGNYDTRFSEIYLRIGTVLVSESCLILNSSFVQCKLISNVDTSIKFDLSYNRLDWYPTSSNFTFVPCPAGFGTSSYGDPCIPCPPGQFKTSKGISTCTYCPVNTFSNQIGSTNCTSCPFNMKSPGTTTGLKSASECVCINNTMVHPTHRMCVNCPAGAICSPENVSLPISQSGWWFSRENITIFYQCLPASRCIPSSPDNCTEGYEGLRCGRCANGYFKSKLICKKCNDRVITAITLVVSIIVVIAIIMFVAVFFVITSTKISQFASYSITFGYWQIISTFTTLDINWPSVVDITLSGAQASNFNFDFLGPECIFRIFGLQFSYYYVYFTNISLPYTFLLAFILIYFISVLRSLFAATIGFKIAKMLKLKYKKPLESDEDSDDEEVKKKSKFFTFVKGIYREMVNSFIWFRNFIIWSIRQKSSTIELKRLFSKIVGAYLSFISFFYLKIMTTSFQIFGCDWQPNGIYTFKESPDILWLDFFI